MRDLEAVAIECMEMLDKINIKYGNIKSITINTRARARWGQCKKIPGTKEFTININQDLLDERNSVDGLKNTIIHELLHSVEGCMNHGPKWKKQADIVENTYGIHITRTSSAEDKGIEYRRSKSVRQSTGKLYIIECERCGYQYRHQRMSKSVQHPDWYGCGRCNGSLVRIM